MSVLLILVERAGDLVPKDTIVERAWGDTAVTDNSLVQIIRALRRALGNQPGGAPYIETHTRSGYRFVAPVSEAHQAVSGAEIGALLEPFLAFVDGRAALERLDCEGAARARDAFTEILRVEPSLVVAHVGLATACLLGYESTRADAVPDTGLLARAEEHAREGCRLDPASAHAWGTFALVRHRAGDAREAVAASRKALTLDPDDWTHHFRLAAVSWGSERLRAARQALALRPGLALAHWFAATVFVARGDLDRAREHLCEGSAAQDAQQADGRFRAAGLHWLLGLVLFAQGREDDALAEFQRELALEDLGHVYGREASANTFYALGAHHVRAGREDEATFAFREALKRVPGHALASLCVPRRNDANAAVSPASLLGRVPAIAIDVLDSVDTAVGAAIWLTMQGRHQEATGLCVAALHRAAPGSSGWILPVEPMLNVWSRREPWIPALTILRERAS